MKFFGSPDIQKLKARGAVTKLGKLLFKEDRELAAQAAAALETMGDKAVIYLIALLQHKHSSKQPHIVNKYRVAATELLLQMGNLAVNAVIKLLDAKRDWQAIIAAETLAVLDAPAAVPHLISCLKGNKWTEFKIACIKTLGSIGDTNAVQPLIEVLENDASGRLRAVAASALGEIADESAVTALQKALDNGYSEAAAAIKKIQEQHKE